jgi:iron(III) transport system substrate-binding protein
MSRAAALAALPLVLAARPARAQTDELAKLAAAAKPEGRVIVYWSGSADKANALSARFAATYGITAEILSVGSDEMPAKVMTEDRGGLHNVDVIGTNQLQEGLLAQVGLIEAFRPPEARDLLPGTFDPNGLWGSAVFLETEGIAYNPTRLQSLGIKPPASWEDLTRPEWRGQFGVTTNDVEWYVALRRFYGKERHERLMRALAANQPRLTSSHTLGLNLIAAGEILAMTAAFGPQTLILKRKGASIEYVNPTPTVLQLNCIALAKHAPHPNAARLFIRWWLTRPTQTWFMGILDLPSARKDVTADPAILSPRIHFEQISIADSATYADDIRAFHRTFNMPG